MFISISCRFILSHLQSTQFYFYHGINWIIEIHLFSLQFLQFLCTNHIFAKVECEIFQSKMFWKSGKDLLLLFYSMAPNDLEVTWLDGNKSKSWKPTIVSGLGNRIDSLPAHSKIIVMHKVEIQLWEREKTRKKNQIELRCRITCHNKSIKLMRSCNKWRYGRMAKTFFYQPIKVDTIAFAICTWLCILFDLKPSIECKMARSVNAKKKWRAK